MKNNKAYMVLGTSYDTSEFACDCIKYWWLNYGKYDYPTADSILIRCDCGGSNGYRHYIFKKELQRLSNEIGLEIRIAHYPPYTSKYNPIEHRVFPHITRACQGAVFSSINLVKDLIERAKTKTGLKVFAHIIDKVYEKGKKVSDDFKKNMSVIFDDCLPKLNYRVIPQN